MRRILQNGWPLLAALVLAVVGQSESWLAHLRPTDPELRQVSTIWVTAEGDSGPGSLRSAIVAANRADGRPQILFRIEQVKIRSTLPPLVNPAGVIINGRGRAGIRAARPLPEALLEVISPRSRITGLRLEAKGNVALLVHGDSTAVENVVLERSATGLLLAPGASHVAIRNSRFEDNGVGVRVNAAAGATSLRDNTFIGSKLAGIWAVRPESADAAAAAAVTPLDLVGNRFEQGGHGVVLVNRPAVLRRNEFIGCRQAAIHAAGPGYVIAGNRVREGEAMGILAVGMTRSLVEDNEIDHNQAVGILMKDSGGVRVKGNRIYRNGYGVAAAFGDPKDPDILDGNHFWAQRHDGLWLLAASPVLRENRVMSGAGAGLRVLRYVRANGETSDSFPVLEDNLFRDNLWDEPQPDEYHEEQAAEVEG